MSDVVVHVVADGRATSPPLATVVSGDGCTQFHNLCPEWIVVIFTINSIEIDIGGIASNFRIFVGRIFISDRLNRTFDTTRDIDDLQAQNIDRKFQLFDRFFRIIQENSSDRGEAIAIFAIKVSVVVIDGALQSLTILIATTSRRQDVIREKY